MFIVQGVSQSHKKESYNQLQVDMCQNTSSFILISLIMKDVKEKLIFGWQFFIYIYIYI